VVDEMQDSVKIDGKSITTAFKSVSSSNELFPSLSTCRDWHNHYEKFNELKIDTTHFYNTLASSIPGIGNGFVKSVNWTEEKTSFLVAILNENPEFYLDEIVDAYLRPGALYMMYIRAGHRGRRRQVRRGEPNARNEI
jgi:hypothetical protein